MSIQAPKSPLRRHQKVKTKENRLAKNVTVAQTERGNSYYKNDASFKMATVEHV